MKIGNKEMECITVTKDNKVMAVITDDEIIADNGAIVDFEMADLIKFKKGANYIQEGQVLQCYELTNEYAFLCPYNEKESVLNIENTSVFPPTMWKRNTILRRQAEV